jgi:hypothetical protein
MRVKLITGVTGDQRLSPSSLRRIRVAGTAALVGAVQVKQGGTVIETLAIGTAVGVEREYDDGTFGSTSIGGGDLDINMANAGDSLLVFYT